MSFRDVTKKSVLLAIKEFDKLGGNVFLKKYGFRKSNKYFLLHNGIQYDTKPILGAAHAYEFGEPLDPYGFIGEKKSVATVLLKLGFEIIAQKISENSTTIPEEVSENKIYEGATITIKINRFEKSPQARLECISYHGSNCAICDFNFAQHYGIGFAGFIHIHHIKPLAEIKKEYKVNPITDLIPICPNCHAIFHHESKNRTVEEVKTILG